MGRSLAHCRGTRCRLHDDESRISKGFRESNTSSCIRKKKTSEGGVRGVREKGYYLWEKRGTLE